MKIIEINLLPTEYRPPPLYSLRNIAILVLLFLVVSFLILLALQTGNLKNEYDNECKQLMQNIKIYKKQKQQIDKLMKRENALNHRREIILELIGQRFTWSDKLISLYEQIPDNLWLSSILLERKKIEVSKTTSKLDKREKKEKSQNEEKEVPQVILLHILGDTLALPQISEFIVRLDESPSFENTELLSIGRSEKKGRSVMSFEIITQLKGEEVKG